MEKQTHTKWTTTTTKTNRKSRSYEQIKKDRIRWITIAKINGIFFTHAKGNVWLGIFKTLTRIQNIEIIKCWGGYEVKETLAHCWWKYKITVTMEDCWVVLYKIKQTLTHPPILLYWYSGWNIQHQEWILL